MDINLENIESRLIEVMGDFLDSWEVRQEESAGGFGDPVQREESELHIRMAKSAIREYINTVQSESFVSGKTYIWEKSDLWGAWERDVAKFLKNN